MKLLMGCAALVLCSSALADPGAKCEAWEYAKLKDSTRQELDDRYCSAKRREKLNEDLGGIKKTLFARQLELGNTAGAEVTRREMAALGDARVGCFAAAEDAHGMLKKKFKATGEPPCK